MLALLAIELALRLPAGMRAEEIYDAEVVHTNRGSAPAPVLIEDECGLPVDIVLLDGEDARPATLVSCPPGGALVFRTLRPGQSVVTRVPIAIPTRLQAGVHRLQARDRDGAESAVVTARIGAADPAGPVVELRLLGRPRAGRPVAVEIRHVNTGSRTFILYDERCGGTARDFVLVDGIEQAIGAAPARCERRMDLAPGHRFVTRARLALDPGPHRLEAVYRLVAPKGGAAWWTGEMRSTALQLEMP